MQNNIFREAMIKKISLLTSLILSTSLASAHTIEEALAITYENNNELKAKREELKAADESIMQALSRFLPSMKAQKSNSLSKLRNATQTTLSNGAITKTPEGTVENSGITSAFTIEQNLFRGGADVATMQKAKHQIEEQRANLKKAEQQVLLSAIQAYLNVANFQTQLEIANKRVETSKKFLESIEARFKAGENTKSDVAQSRSSLSKAIAMQIDTAGALEAAKAKYATVITVAPENVSLPPINIIVPSNLDEAVTMALKNSPDIVAAERQYQAANQNVNVAKAALMPVASLSQQWQNAKHDPNSSYNLSSVTTLGVSVPIFNGGADWSEIRKSKRVAQAYKYSSLNTKQSVTDFTVKAWSDYESRKAAMTAQEDYAESAKVAYEGMLEEEKAGLRSSVDVISQQNSYFDADAQLAKAKTENVLYRYVLKSAIGELTAKDLNLKVTAFDPLQNYNKIRWELIGSF